MTELQTFLGKDIPVETRGILYLCKYSYSPPKLEVLREMLFNSGYEALMYYAEIPNPESQMVSGKTFDEMIKELHSLHNKITDQKWLKQLGDAL